MYGNADDAGTESGRVGKSRGGKRWMGDRPEIKPFDPARAKMSDQSLLVTRLEGEEEW
jgi:hypothetical protein